MTDPSYKAWCLGCRKVVHVDDIPLAGALMCPKCTLPMMDLEEALEAMAEWWSRVDRGEIELTVSGKVRSCKGCLNVWPIDMTKCPACGGENFDPKTYSPAPTGFEARGCGQPGGRPRRPESGPMKFGDDWTGVFFRGDQAFFFSVMVERHLAGDVDVMTRAALKGLIESLNSCVEETVEPDEGVQVLKPYPECVEE